MKNKNNEHQAKWYAYKTVNGVNSIDKIPNYHVLEHALHIHQCAYTFECHNIQQISFTVCVFIRTHIN